MKIELAENYGFCFGVKRAIKIAEENKNAATYGPLIHNSKELIKILKLDLLMILQLLMQVIKRLCVRTELSKMSLRHLKRAVLM